MKKEWLAVYVKSRTEKKVGALLSERGIQSYVPIVKTMRQWSDRKKAVHLPLIHGYVFVQVGPSEQERVLQVRGVVSFVRSAGSVAVVRDHEIERLRQLVELGYQMEARPIDENLRRGSKVRILSGVLKDMHAEVIEDGENSQVEVLLESIGHSITVWLPKQLLINA